MGLLYRGFVQSALHCNLSITIKTVMAEATVRLPASLSTAGRQCRDQRNLDRVYLEPGIEPVTFRLQPHYTLSHAASNGR